MDKDSKIYVAGHRGLVGSAIVKKMKARGYTNVITRRSDELDLRIQSEVACFLQSERLDYVILAAGRVGGIMANIEYPAEFLYDNIMIQTNIIHQSYLVSVKKVLILGSSCIYPRECPQPMKEEYLLDGKLEPTNEGYALSKIVALKQGEYYKKQYGFNVISVMPCNLYGYNDSFDPKHSHVLSATVKKVVDAIDEGREEIVMWGSGVARREFMNIEDMADSCLFMLEHYEGETFINIGTGEDISIKELVEEIARIAGYTGRIVWDTTKPDGMLRKCLDVSKMRAMGVKAKIPLSQGIEEMISYYKKIKAE